MPVKLNDVIEALDTAAEGCAHYLHRHTGEIVIVTDEEMEAAEEDELISEYPDWQREAILKAREILTSENFVELPDQFDIHDYAIMEAFCLTYENRPVGEELRRLIKGSGAFKRFKNGIYSVGAEKAWYEFRRVEIEKIAIAWLDENKIAYRAEDSIDDAERTM